MSDDRNAFTATEEQHERMLRVWHLAILRFAVTLDKADRLNVFAIAEEMDRLGQQPWRDEFRFFRMAGLELCLAMTDQSVGAPAILHRYSAQIAEPRLKRAFMAAVGMCEPVTAPMRQRSKQPQNLFRGLPSRSSNA